MRAILGLSWGYMRVILGLYEGYTGFILGLWKRKWKLSEELPVPGG